MTFFLTCEEEGSKVIVIPSTETMNPPQDYRPTEYGYNTIVGPGFAVDRNFYEYLQENVSIVEKFLLKRQYINLVLGKVYNNFLSPTHFFCHIRGCKKELPLGGCNEISNYIVFRQNLSRLNRPILLKLKCFSRERNTFLEIENHFIVSQIV